MSLYNSYELKSYIKLAFRLGRLRLDDGPATDGLVALAFCEIRGPIFSIDYVLERTTYALLIMIFVDYVFLNFQG